MNMEFSTTRYLLELSFSVHDGLIYNCEELIVSDSGFNKANDI